MTRTFYSQQKSRGDCPYSYWLKMKAVKLYSVLLNSSGEKKETFSVLIIDWDTFYVLFCELRAEKLDVC